MTDPQFHTVAPDYDLIGAALLADTAGTALLLVLGLFFAAYAASLLARVL